MRQAGRYLPEYRQVRAGVSFLELCKTPKLAAEVTLQPIRRFGFDAAILFSDLLVPLEAMGLAVEFTDEGPRLPAPLRTPGRSGARRPLRSGGAHAASCMETIELARAAAGRHAAHRLRGRAVHGRDLRDRGEDRRRASARPRASSTASPTTARRLLALIGEATRDYLLAQIRAGAQAVQLFDSWVGVLSAEDFETFVLPPTAGAGRGAARDRRAGHLLRQRRGHDPRSRRARRRRRLRHRLARCRSTRRARGSAARARRAGEPRSGGAARPDRRDRAARARRSSAAAASAATSSTWDTASPRRRRSRRSRRWWPRSGAHDGAGGARRARAAARARRSASSRSTWAGPTRSTTSSRSCAGCSAIPRSSSSAGCARCSRCWRGRSRSGARRCRARPTRRSAGARRSSRRRRRRPRRSPPSSAARGRRRRARSWRWPPGTRSPTRRWPRWPRDGVERAIALPLYPHESRTTTGLVAQPARGRRALARAGLEIAAVRRYPDADGYLRAVVERDRGGDRHAARRARGDGAGAVLGARAARGVHPQAAIRTSTTSASPSRRSSRRMRLGPRARLCFQSRVGPQRWLGPDDRGGARRAGGGGDARRRRRADRLHRRAHRDAAGDRHPLPRARREGAASSTSRAPAPSACHPAFIAALADLAEGAARARGWALRRRVRIAVIGGGISGLAAAHGLVGARARRRARRRRGRTGRARRRAARRDGFLCEHGPQALLDGSEEVRALIAGAGLERADRARPRPPRGGARSTSGGALRPFPASPPALVKTSLLGARGKLRLLREPFVRRGGGERRVGVRLRGPAIRRRGRSARRRARAHRHLRGRRGGAVGAPRPSRASPRSSASTAASCGECSARAGGSRLGRPRFVSRWPRRAAARAGRACWDRGAGRAGRARSSRGAAAGASCSTARPSKRSGSCWRRRPPPRPRCSRHTPPRRPKRCARSRTRRSPSCAWVLAPGGPGAGAGHGLSTATVSSWRAAKGSRLLGCQYRVVGVPGTRARGGRAPARARRRDVRSRAGRRRRRDPRRPGDRRSRGARPGSARDPDFVDVWRARPGIPQYDRGHLARVRAVDDALARLPGLSVIGHALRGVGVGACIAIGDLAPHATSALDSRRRAVRCCGTEEVNHARPQEISSCSRSSWRPRAAARWRRSASRGGSPSDPEEIKPGIVAVELGRRLPLRGAGRPARGPVRRRRGPGRQPGRRRAGRAARRAQRRLRRLPDPRPRRSHGRRRRPRQRPRPPRRRATSPSPRRRARLGQPAAPRDGQGDGDPGDQRDRARSTACDDRSRRRARRSRRSRSRDTRPAPTSSSTTACCSPATR